MTFRGRTVIVTGGTGALGAVIVHRFAELGANIAVPSSATSSEDSTRQRIGIERERFMLGKADLRNGDEAETFVRQVSSRFGRIDVLVNAAGGYSGGKRISETSVADLMQLFNLNSVSAFNMCSKVLPFMVQSGYGRIVNIAALAAIHPQSGAGAYAISKGAVVTLTETIALENKRNGVTANVIAPGTILTEANKTAMPDADFSKWITPDQIAEVVLFLSSEASSAVSGNTFVLS